MKILRPLVFALTGWAAGAIATVVAGLSWPSIFPAIVLVEHYYGAGPSLLTIIVFGIILASPGGLAGGIIGSRIPREGGQSEQYIMAAILGIVFTLPLACFVLWFFTGW
jgi:hypothetical protein